MMIEKPINRSPLRLQLGKFYYGCLRKLLWIKKRNLFSAKYHYDDLPYLAYQHQTPLLRKLKDVDMWLQYNKITNLKIATKAINGIVLRPGEIMSYWKLIGNPNKQKGYVEGMILENGTFKAGIGGGLCQLSNLLFWMTIHTPLTILERHRHGYDVFPDSSRTQPFGSGATCFYPHGDLMIQNNTQDTYQILVDVEEEYLVGQIRVSSQPKYTYEIVEKDHEMRLEYWGGYSRNNALYQQKFNQENQLVEEIMIVKNEAIMMYAPFLDTQEKAYVKNAQ